MTTNIGIVSKPGRSDLPQLLRELTAWLDERGVAWTGDIVTETYLGLKGGFDRTAETSTPDQEQRYPAPARP